MNKYRYRPPQKIGRIYLIYNPDSPNQIFIGSSKAKLGICLCRHMTNFLGWKNGNTESYCASFKILSESDKCVISLLKECKYEEMSYYETKFISEMKNVNIITGMGLANGDLHVDTRKLKGTEKLGSKRIYSCVCGAGEFVDVSVNYKQCWKCGKTMDEFNYKLGNYQSVICNAIIEEKEKKVVVIEIDEHTKKFEDELDKLIAEL